MTALRAYPSRTLSHDIIFYHDQLPRSVPQDIGNFAEAKKIASSFYPCRDQRQGGDNEARNAQHQRP
jgi:hypothetical protein